VYATPRAVLAADAEVAPVPPAVTGRAALRSSTISSILELNCAEVIVEPGVAVVPVALEYTPDPFRDMRLTSTT
jgi:hypothetical protein